MYYYVLQCNVKAVFFARISFSPLDDKTNICAFPPITSLGSLEENVRKNIKIKSNRQHRNIKLKQVPTNYLLAPTRTQRQTPTDTHLQTNRNRLKVKATAKHIEISKNRQTEIH